MKDLTVVHVEQDRTEAQELNLELQLLGARVSLTEVTGLSALLPLIETRLGDHSSVLLFATPAFSAAALTEKIELRNPPTTVLPLTYTVKVDLRKKLSREIDGLVETRSRSIQGFAIEVLKELGSNQRGITLVPARTFEECWQSPLFLYRKTEGFDETQETLVDVTWAAKPIQSEPASLVLGVFREVFQHLAVDKHRILDFGAGKLRYTVFLLEQGHRVTAVDYPEPFERPTPEIETALKKAQGNKKRFDRVLYPSQLLPLNKSFDLALLINVINIVPDPLERLFVLDQCNRKLDAGGHLIWFGYYGDLTQLEAASDKTTDGGCTRQKGRKTFYKNLPKREAVRLGHLMGFEVVEGVRFEVDKNVACLFRKAREPLIDVRSLQKARTDLIGRKVFFGAAPSEHVVADVLDSRGHHRIGDFLAHTLAATQPGKADAYRYEELIHRVVEYVFRNNFKSSLIQDQYEISKGRQRIDIKANWSTSSPLKTIVVDEYGLKTSFVPIECKNYSGILGNKEFGQMVDRCDKRWRHFGMILCRKMKDKNKVLDQCNDRLSRHGYLITPFDDNDVKALLRLADREVENGDQADEVAEYVRVRIEEVAER